MLTSSLQEVALGYLDDSIEEEEKTRISDALYYLERDLDSGVESLITRLRSKLTDFSSNDKNKITQTALKNLANTY
ncbi:MAG: hypothetical protein WCK16_02030 [Candidatus Moraniibacteriota bacterium]|jgi:hypothetical protein